VTKREIKLLRKLGHLLRKIREMTDDEARQILDRAESSDGRSLRPEWLATA
jgi:hypothetical protein